MPAARIESQRVDVKEEPGRRDRDGKVVPGKPHSERAATYLADELACLANSGGGAIVLGFADDGSPIGTDLDPEWLRHRVYELTDRKLTVSIDALDFCGVRALELVVPAALEPVRFRGKIRQRVGKNCVEIDAATWADAHQRRVGYDWSAEQSSRTLAEVRAGALETARDFLLASGEAAAADLAMSADHDLVRRLGLCDDEGHLVNAGALLLCAGPAVIDYRRREVAGGDAVTRVSLAGRSLLEQLSRVIDAIRVHNPQVELDTSWARGQTNRVPDLATREALVNGVTHRDWITLEPTVVEHVGDQFTATSPGGFVGGVAPENIITHPSVPRYPRLAQTLATLRIAERQGIGVDRMHRDMLALGLPPPVIEELSGPFVRTVLIGGAPDRAWLTFRSMLEPVSGGEDLDFLLVLDLAARRGWVDGPLAGAAIQRSRGETSDVLNRLHQVRLRGFREALVGVEGDPAADREPYDAAWQLSPPARHILASSTRHRPPPRRALLVDYARQRGRISSTEAASIIHTSVNTARSLLDELERGGELRAGREQRLGRGFFYVPA